MKCKTVIQAIQFIADVAIMTAIGSGLVWVGIPLMGAFLYMVVLTTLLIVANNISEHVILPWVVSHIYTEEDLRDDN